MSLDHAPIPLRNNTPSGGPSGPSNPDRRRQNNHPFADQSTMTQRPDLNRESAPVKNSIQSQQYTDAYRFGRSSLGSNPNPYPSQEPEKSIGHKQQTNRVPSGSQFVPFTTFDPPPPVEQRSSAQEVPSSMLQPDFKDRWRPLTSMGPMQSMPNAGGYGQSAGTRRDERPGLPPGMSNGRRGGHVSVQPSTRFNRREPFSKRMSFFRS